MTELEYQTERLRIAIERAELAEANNAKACAALKFIHDHTVENTLPNVTAKAELRRQK